MSDHLDECPEVFIDCYGSSCDCEYSHFCICDALRSCEVRVRGEEQQRIEAALTFVGQHDAAWELAVRDKALRDAREAVDHFHRGSCRWYYTERKCSCGLHAAIDALRALREEKR
jgi:hypothetical protein